MPSQSELTTICQQLRRLILISTTQAGSGHATSSLSAVELMATLMFNGHFKAQLDEPLHPANDRLIFSKGHAAPLLYALYCVAGKLTEQELLTLRQIDSPLEGHPTMEFPYTEAPTGSLGQGLSIGFGIALNNKYLDHVPSRVFVLIGDSELAEGSNWETLQLAAHYQLDNLIGILDVNRLGQRGETMDGHDLKAIEQKIKAFGWRTIVVNNGHSLTEVEQAYQQALSDSDNSQPVMIIVKTLKGKGVSLWENQQGWHSKTLSKEQLVIALHELGNPTTVKNFPVFPREQYQKITPKQTDKKSNHLLEPDFSESEKIATKEAFGKTLAWLCAHDSEIISLDAEVSNSTGAEFVKKAAPHQFFEMFIAEQNMVGAAVGLSRMGKRPVVSTFAAFFSRAFDQIRMAQYANSNIVFVGPYAGVSLGKDGTSQMGIEDLSMFQTLFNCTVLYPSDAESTRQLLTQSVKHPGLIYLRLTREPTPLLYTPNDEITIGGIGVPQQADGAEWVIIGGGITTHEALKAAKQLQEKNIATTVIDCYSLSLSDASVLQLKQIVSGKKVIIVEDHRPFGGLYSRLFPLISGEASQIHHLAVSRIPHSGSPEDVLRFEEIDAEAIVHHVTT